MKTKTAVLVLIAGLLVLVSGCAQFAPVMVDPAVYKTSRDVTTARNRAQKQNIELEQTRAVEYNKVAITEIAAANTGDDNGQSAVISKDGVLGGFECLFTSESSRRGKNNHRQKDWRFYEQAGIQHPLGRGRRG